MSALTMVVMAGMAVGDVPEKVPEEIEQGLDLRGDWAGVWKDFEGGRGVVTGGAGLLKAKSEGYLLHCHTDHIVDESGGRCSVWVGPSEKWLGIYKQEGNRVTLCFRKSDRVRPRSLTSSNGQCLLILHRVKPRK